MRLKILIAIAVVLAAVFGAYYLRTTRTGGALNEASPLAAIGTDESKLPAMDEETKAAFAAQMRELRGSGEAVNDSMPPGDPALVAEGDFERWVHSVKGRALLIDGPNGKTLRFEDFETDNGPQLVVYLATDRSADDVIDLGGLRATKGNLNYEVPDGVDTSKHKYVLIWCRPFRVLFSYAVLEPAQ